MKKCALLVLLLVASAANLTARGEQGSGEKIVLRYNNPVPSSGPQWERMVMVKEAVEAADPSMEVQLYTDLVEQGSEITALARGSVDMLFANLALMSKFDDNYLPFTMAYNFKNPRHAERVLSDQIMAKLNASFEEQFNMKFLAPTLVGVRHLNTRDLIEVTSVADLNGLNLRVINSPAYVRIGKALGANPTPLAFSELYLSLQTGAVDAEENPLSIIRSNKFYEVTKQVVLTGHFIGVGYEAINADTWNKLTPKQQQILQKAVEDATTWYAKTVIAKLNEDTQFLKDQGMTVVNVPNIDSFRKEVLSFYRNDPETKDWDFSLVDTVNSISEDGSRW